MAERGKRKIKRVRRTVTGPKRRTFSMKNTWYYCCKEEKNFGAKIRFTNLLAKKWDRNKLLAYIQFSKHSISIWKVLLRHVLPAKLAHFRPNGRTKSEKFAGSWRGKPLHRAFFHILYFSFSASLPHDNSLEFLQLVQGSASKLPVNNYTWGPVENASMMKLVLLLVISITSKRFLTIFLGRLPLFSLLGPLPLVAAS